MNVKCSRCGNEDLRIGIITAANGGQGSTEYKCNECGGSGEVIHDETAGFRQKSTWTRGNIERV